MRVHVLLLFSLPCVRAFIGNPAVKQPGTRRSVLGSFRHAVSQTAASLPQSETTGPTASPVTRRSFIKAGAVIGTYSASKPLHSAFAAEAPPSPAAAFQGFYTDPGHPKGYRIVRLTGKGTAVVELQDDPKGEVFNIAAKVVEKKGEDTKILIDFSAKGGPKDVTAVYKDGGLVFPDGNKWPKEMSSGFQGFYTDPGHPKGYRIVRSTGKGTAVVELQDDPKGEVLNIAAKVVEKKGEDTKILIDFSVKGGPKDVTAVYKDEGLVFPDGNKWPKTV